MVSIKESLVLSALNGLKLIIKAPTMNTCYIL